MSKTSRLILAAEDEESDRMILELAFQRAKLPHALVIVRDGQEAVDYLSGQGRYSDRATHPPPALLILDLKMPRMSGFDVLTWLELRPEFKELPVVVLSSSPDESDITKARELGACDYFVKPHSFERLVEMVRQMQARWLAAPPSNAARLNQMSALAPAASSVIAGSPLAS